MANLLLKAVGILEERAEREKKTRDRLTIGDSHILKKEPKIWNIHRCRLSFRRKKKILL